MMILVVDSVPAACSILASDLKATLGYRTLCATSTSDALGRMAAEKDAIGVVVLVLELGPEAGLSVIQKIREFCRAAAIRVPRFLVLAPGPMSDGYEGRFRIVGAQCLLLGYVQQVFVTVRRLIFEALCEKGRSTILVDRSGPHSKFLVLGSVRPELIPYGHRLLPLMNCLAINFGTELSTSALAEVADITIGSVRVYLNRLRARYDEARIKVGVDIPGREVFFTKRKDGAFVHVLRARVIFN